MQQQQQQQQKTHDENKTKITHEASMSSVKPSPS